MQRAIRCGGSAPAPLQSLFTCLPRALTKFSPMGNLGTSGERRLESEGLSWIVLGIVLDIVLGIVLWIVFGIVLGLVLEIVVGLLLGIVLRIVLGIVLEIV